MQSYDTVTEAVAGLKQRGYSYDFNLQKDCLFCPDREIRLHPVDFMVDEVYRFEGDSDPGDENAVYAISSLPHQIKGVLVTAYGTYADRASSELLDKLQFKS